MSKKNAIENTKVPHNPGDRDGSFGNHGVIRSVTATFAADPTAATDQRFYMANVIVPFGTDLTEIFRYNTDGTMDSEFGRVEIPALQQTYTAALDVEGLVFNQPAGEEGTITCVGVTIAIIDGGLYCYPAAARITTSGKIDETFGEKGVMLFKFRKPADGAIYLPTRYPSSFNIFRATVRHPTGDILFCCGLVDFNIRETTYVLVRMKSDGRPDESFGEEGVKVITSAYEANPPHWFDCSVDSGGRVMLVGATPEWNAGIVTRYNFAGDVDLTKTISLNEPGLDCHIVQSHVSDTGSITLLVYAGEPGQPHSRIAVLKLNESGETDETFNKGKHVFVDEIEAQVPCLDVDREGRIIVTGASTQSKGVGRVVRLLPNGERDTAFGDGGSKEYPDLTPINRGVIQNGVDILALTHVRDVFGDLEMVRLFGEGAA